MLKLPPPEWAAWASVIRAIRESTGISVPFDDKNSGQALAAMIAERANPVADVLYFGGQVGIQARAGRDPGLKPPGFDQVSAGMKDPDGYWFAIHSGTLGLFVNIAALGGKPVPRSWKDLLKPDYGGMVGYLDPTSAAVSFIGANAVNVALGGDYGNCRPAIDCFKQLARNEPIVPKQTAYARVLSGEILILPEYDFDAYRTKYKDQAPAEFVVPAEGTVSFPYVMALVAHAPHVANGKRVLNFVLSPEKQAMWARAFLRPVPSGAMTPEVEQRFLPASDYARAKPVDLAALAAAQRSFSQLYLSEVR